MDEIKVGVDYRKLFRSCGKDVIIEPGVIIEHPESFEVGDRVRFMQGFIALGRPRRVTIGNDVEFWPNVIIQGSGTLTIGNNVRFLPNNYLELGGSFIEIGSNTHFAPNCVLYGQGGLRVGDHCGIAAHVVFATVGHDHRVRDRLMVDTAKSAPITLEGDNWVGANAVLIGGVTMAGGSVLGAGAVLTKNTEPYGVYAGVPARLIQWRPVDKPPVDQTV